LVALWLSPLVPLSRTVFPAHMLLHLGLILLAAPLLALSIARRLPDPGSFGEAARWYLLAGAFEMVTVWGWHVPLLHDLAGHNTLAFGAEQGSFLLGGIVLWTAIFTARQPASAIAAAVVAALTFSHMTMFGLLLAVAPKLLYDPDLCQGWLGIDRLDGQHLGGALMAAAGIAYLVAAIVLLSRSAGDRALQS
jgi:putative membrane protein